MLDFLVVGLGIAGGVMMRGVWGTYVPSGKREVYLSVLEYRYLPILFVSERKVSGRREETDENVVEIDTTIQQRSLSDEIIRFRQ